MLGVHTPESVRERNKDAVRFAAERFGLAQHPHLIDNDKTYWRALNNHFWPTFYLIDKCGRIRDVRVGEMHSETPDDAEVSELTEALLSEKSAECEDLR